MLVIGQGGTGNSVLINAITETFAFHGRQQALAKCATSGIAATPIGGTMVHFWAGLGITRAKKADWLTNASPKLTARRKRNILGKICLIIDEMSMLYDALLNDIAQVVAHIKKTENKGYPHLPFAGMHIILMGDFHQFPPVANATSALYSLSPIWTPEAAQGRALYKRFDTVAQLQIQIHVRDAVWTELLGRLRVGECNDGDLHKIRRLIIGHPDCLPTNFQVSPWCDAILVTTRHSVREAWNAASLNLHCRKSGQIKYIAPSEDYVKECPPRSLSPIVKLVVAGQGEKLMGKLADRVKLAIGMKVMVLLNLSTKGDIANGTRGTIQDIVLDHREISIEVNDDGIVKLTYPPAMIFFKPDTPSSISSAFQDTRVKKRLRTLDGNVPLTPSTSTFKIKTPDGQESTIVRRQFALTGSYAFTDIKSQGQTIEVVLVDLRNPLSGKLSPFSAYVALSRSRGRDTIRLLSDFDEDLFCTHPNPDLAVEINRLNFLVTSCRA